MVDPGEFLSLQPITKPEDLKGMRIRFSESAQESMIKKFGGTPVGLAMPEVYDSLERGIIDGVAVGPSVIASYKLNEVIKYATRGLRSFFSTQVIFMNKDKWESLSPEDQKLLDSLTGTVIYEKGTEIYMGAYEKGFSLGKESGVTINDISEADRQVWKEKAAPVVDEYLEKMKEKGLPGKEILDMMHEISAKFKQ
jgi:TRAP-type C4-dicarboxylate transport system substrate-binding protein